MNDKKYGQEIGLALCWLSTAFEVTIRPDDQMEILWCLLLNRYILSFLLFVSYVMYT